MAGSVVNFEKLRERATAEKWSDRALAKHTGISHDAVNRILKGQNDPQATNLKKICDAIGLPIQDAFVDKLAA